MISITFHNIKHKVAGLRLVGPPKELALIRGTYNDGKYTIMPLTPMSAFFAKAAADHGITVRVANEIEDWLKREANRRNILAEAYENPFDRQWPKSLHRFQLAGAEFIYTAKRVLLGDDPRLGKTVQSLAAISRLARGKPILVVTMKSLTANWANEVPRWTTDYKAQVVSGPKTNRQRILSNMEEGIIYITNWETLKMLKDTMIKKVEYFIGDEVHVVRNRKAQVTKAFMKLRPKCCVLASATMIESGPQDYYPLLHIIDPVQFNSYWRFVNWYVKVVQGFFGLELGEPINTDLLKDHLAPISLRRKAEDIVDVPEKMFETVFVEAPNELMQVYKKIAKEIIIDINASEQLIIPNALARMVRLQQISVAPFTLGFDLPTPKIDALIDYIKGVSSKVVVFTSFRGAATRIVEGLLENEISALRYVGNDPDPTSFVQGKTQVLVTTPNIGGVGQDFSMADIIIYADLPLSATKLIQSQERTTKLGLKKPRLILSLICTPIDRKIAELLAEKQNTINDVDIYDTIINLLEEA